MLVAYEGDDQPTLEDLIGPNGLEAAEIDWGFGLPLATEFAGQNGFTFGEIITNPPEPKRVYYVARITEAAQRRLYARMGQPYPE